MPVELIVGETMRTIANIYALLSLVLIIAVSPCFSAEQSTPKEVQESKYLNAVRTFADNVLKYGRDTYGPKHTPLFVDGVNIRTHDPVKWKSPKGNVLQATEYNEWIISNFASQQILMRTLDGLSSLTGDSQYRDAAKQAIAYVFKTLRAPNGLIYWGQVAAYDAQADRAIVEDRNYYQPAYGFSHSFKFTHPHYELMWQVDPQATQKFIEAFWSAHILDWSNLDMNRGVPFDGTLEPPWNHEYKGGPVPFQTPYEYTGAFFNTGSILAYSGASLAKLSGEDKPLIWTKRLVQRYIDTRDPNTGISAYAYNYSTFRSRSFPLIPFQYRFLDYPEERHVHPWLTVLLAGEMLGEKGQPLTQWVLEEMTAWGKASYRKKDNSFVPILIDGTNLEGYVEEDSPQGLNVAGPCPAGPQYFWAYCVAYHATSDSYMWEMVRDIAVSNELGDVGRTPSDAPELSIYTDCSHPYILLGFLQLHEKTGKSEFLEMARRIGDNILLNRRNKGFFVPSKKHVYTMFDCREPLALLHLEARLHARTESIPTVWPSLAKYIAPYRFKPLGVDSVLIYTLTESNEPTFSLAEAASIGDIDQVRSLVENGTALETVDSKGAQTALQRAAINGHKDVVELLLAHHNRVDLQGDGSSPLHHAVQYGHKSVVEMLVAHGADVNAKDGWGKGKTPLEIASSHNRKDLIELLSSKGAETTSIHLAAQLGDLEKVKAFLERGTDINAKNDDGMTPLLLAISNKQTEVTKFLIENGADVNVGDKQDYVPLVYALGNEDSNTVQLLLDKGADIKSKDTAMGFSVLHWAILMDSKESTELILAAGADVKAKSNTGETPLDVAAYGASAAIGELLAAKGAEVTSLAAAAYMGDIDKVKAFLDEGIDVNQKTGMIQGTALHSAAAGGHQEVVGFLISKGSDVGAQNRAGQTPLHIAAQAGHLEVVQLLLKKGATANAKDSRGRTPTDLAQEAKHEEVVELLKKQLLVHDVAVTKVSAPTSCTQGDTVSVVITLDNSGNRAESCAVKLVDATNDREIALQPVTIHSKHREASDADLTITGEVENETEFGNWCCADGDVNGDGFNDLLITAHHFPSMSVSRGRVYLYYGGPEMDNRPDKRFTGEESGDTFGDNAGFLVDMNNDGFADVILGARHHNNRGRVYVFWGGADMDEEPDIIIDPPAGDGTDLSFGRGGMHPGDFNGDGIMDLACSAIRYNAYMGRVYLYYGPLASDTTVDKVFTGEATDDTFGAIMGVGDVNGDNCDDLLIATRYYPANTGVGRAYLYYGAPGT